MIIYEDKFKDEVVDDVNNGASMYQVSRKYNIPISTVHRWVHRFREQNAAKVDSDTAPRYSVDEIIGDVGVISSILEELRSLKEKNQQLEDQVTEMSPKADYYDNVLDAKDAISVTSIASEFGRSGQWLNAKLKQLGVQYRQNGMWVLTHKYQGNGYTVVKTMYSQTDDGEKRAYNSTYWTQAGRKFIHDLLDE